MTAHAPTPDPRPGLLDERWLTPLEIARKFGYSTDKPIRKAIRSGELKAIHAPCRRKLVVAESEVVRWITRELFYQPAIANSEAQREVARERGGRARRVAMPRLSYDAGTRGA